MLWSAPKEVSFLPPGTFLVDFNIQVTSSLEDAVSHEHGGLHRHSKGQLTIFGSVPALVYLYYHSPIFSLEFQRKHQSCTWQWGAVKTHHLIVQWILNANKPTDEWSRWEESHLPRTQILCAMIGPAYFAMGLIWVSIKGQCRCRMIRRESWIRYGNLIISVQACEKDGKANMGADYFIWKPLSLKHS